MEAVASYSPRPSVQTSGKGHQWWKREKFHTRDDGADKTHCGRDASEWMVLEKRPDQEVIADSDLCLQCARALTVAETPQ